MNNISIDDFQEMSTDRKKSFFTKEILQEWDSLKGAKEVKLQKGKGKVLGGFYIFGWEAAIMLKFKYISKNRARVKDKKEFWDSVIWHENQELSDADILDPNKYNFNTPFRILSKEESKTAGQSKLVREIEKDGECNRQLQKAKKRKCGKFRNWNTDKSCKTPACSDKERWDFIGKSGKNVTAEEGEKAAATAIQSVVRGRSVRNKNNNNKNEVPNGSCKGTGKKCGEVDLRIRGKKMSNIGRQAICKSYPNCDWIKTGGRKKKKKKRRKAFPSRRKNNRKNRTKKKALSK
jgi:hypothetical protein